MKHRRQQTGFTLIEFVIVTVILSIVGLVFSQLLTQGLLSAKQSQMMIDAIWQGQIAMEQIARDIRDTRTSADITANTATQLTITNMAGNSYDFTLSGTNLLCNSQILATGVNTLAFAYYDKNGTVTATTANVQYITIDLNITQNGVNYNLATAVDLRDLTS